MESFSYIQWRSQGWAWMGSCPPKCLLCHTTEIKKDRDTLIEQSNILIKQSVGKVVSCQLTESDYATAYIKSSHLKVSIQFLVYTVLKRTTFLALSVDILNLTMLMQPCSKDTFNNVTVSFK